MPYCPISRRFRAVTFGVALALASCITLAMNGARASDIAAVPKVSSCKLENGVGRVRVTSDRTASAAYASFRLRLYDAKHRWLADELTDGEGIDTPIYPVDQFLDPHDVASVDCSVDGYISASDESTFVQTAPPLVSGREACADRRGIIVDGGPDAAFEAAVIGPDWMMFRIRPWINHFLGNIPTDFAGTVFSATLDKRSEQRALISGAEGPSISFLFTQLVPGLHQVDYGPWPDGTHPYCVRTEHL
jgi:hypothetical protein